MTTNFESATVTDSQVCVLCGETFAEFGNNPDPLANVEDGLCCNHCNDTAVMAARLADLDA